MSLPNSGTIKLSEVKAEFGKGNNLLSYLGEGGVTGSAPLKLTDFYGTSAGPEINQPIHKYAGRVLYARGGSYTTETGPAQPWTIANGDIVIFGANYCYGPNSDPSSISVVNGSYLYHTKYRKEVFEKSPVRWAVGASYEQIPLSNPQFRMVAQGYDPYWPRDFLGYAYVIGADQFPWPAGTPLRAVQNRWGNNIAISDGVPNGYLVVGVLSVQNSATLPVINGMQSVQRGLSSQNYSGVAVGYKIYQFDGGGSLSITIDTVGYTSFYGWYESTRRDAEPLDLTSYENDEKASDSEPALPPLEDE